MIYAKDIMTTDAITLNADDEISKAVQVMLENRINGLPVIEGGVVVGILCQSDLVAQQKKLNLPSLFTLLDGVIPMSSQRDFDREMDKITALTVRQAMTPDPVSVTPGTPIEEVATLMADQKLYTVPVVESGELVGVIGKEDILRTLLPKED